VNTNARNAKLRRLYAAKKLRGECTSCPKKARQGKTTCKDCGKAHSLRVAARKARRRANLIALGICLQCEQRLAVGGPKKVLQCAACLDHHTEHAVEIREEWKAKGLCPRCGRKPLPGSIRCETCKAKRRKAAPLPIAA